MLKVLAVVFVLAAVCRGCTHSTFEGTRITALKDIALDREITDYNFFSSVKSDNVVSLRHITGCLTDVDDLEETVAIQIRGEDVPIFYEGAVQNLLSLHSLHVESCKVTVLRPKTFHNLPSLAVIKFLDNSIDSIPGNVFNNLMVKRLVLSFNNISYISPDAFNDMPRLESVNLDHNKLTKWQTDWFLNCPNVKYLSVKYNQLDAIQARAFRHVQDSLQRLYLDNNNINSVNPRAFAGLKNLTDLSLSKNNISDLDDATFLYLANLKMIDLSETSIACFSEGLLNSLRTDVLLWINNIPLNSTCRDSLEEWAKDNDNSLTFYKTLKAINATALKSKF